MAIRWPRAACVDLGLTTATLGRRGVGVAEATRTGGARHADLDAVCLLEESSRSVHHVLLKSSMHLNTLPHW
jgi:hypothetical protein